METWQTAMPEAMYLKSEGCGSNLSDPTGKVTLKQFCTLMDTEYRDEGLPVPASVFTQYGSWFQQQLVPNLETEKVQRCEQQNDSFVLTLDSGETVTAKSVAVATGYNGSAWLPDQLRGFANGFVSHSSEHRNFTAFRGRDVLVIGAGQSALETAALLQEEGASASLVARRTEIAWGKYPAENTTFLHRLRYPNTALGRGCRSLFFSHRSAPFYHLPRSVRIKEVKTFLGPFGAWWLHDRVVGLIPTIPSCRLLAASVRDDRVILRVERGSEVVELSASHIIAATGYQVSARSFPFLSDELRQSLEWDNGSPLVSKNFESSVPGLYFTGLATAYQFGPVMRFVAGAQVMAPRLANRLARQHLHREAIPSVQGGRHGTGDQVPTAGSRSRTDSQPLASTVDLKAQLSQHG